jgi:cytochrome P450
VKPGRLRGYTEIVRRHADTLIDGFAARGRVDLVEEFCNPFPAGVIGEVLGLPPEDRSRFVHWSSYEGHGARYETQERRDAGAAIVREMGGYVRDAVVSRYEQPRDDIMSDLIRLHAERDGEPDIPNLIGDVATLLIGGIVTSAHMIASATMLLLQNPGELQKVQDDPALVPNMLEETLRLESPVQWQPRLVREDTEVEGVPVRADSIVLMLFASANRDPDKFPDPERFDVERANAHDHLGFGYGIHFCLGAPLARLEGKIAFERFFERLPNLRLAEDNDFRPLDSLVFRGPQRLLVEFDPA